MSDNADSPDNLDDNFGLEFSGFINSLANDPQFQAIGVMAQSLGPLLEQMSDVQRQSTRKLMALFARALDEAGMLVTQSTEDLH